MSTDTLTQALGSRLDLIRQYANEASAADFDRKWYAVLATSGDWFSSMPLRPEQHAEPGGAFRATIETAYYAMRLSGGLKFAADQPSERRRKLEPQYFYALFLAACSTWLDEPYRHFQFYRASDDLEWNPAAHGPFSAWLAGADYRVGRREFALPVERMRTALLARSILGSHRLEALENPVQTELFGAINPETRPAGTETLLHRVIRQAVDVATEFELKARRAQFAPDTTPVPPAHLVATATDERAKPAPKEDKRPARAAATPSTAVAPEESPADAVSALFEQAQATVPKASEAKLPEAAPVQSSLFGLEVIPPKPARKPRPEDPFASVLGNSGHLMREFFRALAQDVEAGKVTVRWVDRGLSVQKRVLGSYGIASDTLLDHLRKLNLVTHAQGADIVLAERIGTLIFPRDPQ
ncbi:TraI domain-containing protein [Ralstonia nicotianae]|uniref:TraI domain-containing protein n=1 Tax=Ralstonia pseudosolanacearum TaxID=1310165 RepID=UPI00399D7A1F